MTGLSYFSTIRLMLGIFKVLGTHGWTLVESIQAGGSKVSYALSFHN